MAKSNPPKPTPSKSTSKSTPKPTAKPAAKAPAKAAHPPKPAPKAKTPPPPAPAKKPAPAPAKSAAKPPAKPAAKAGDKGKAPAPAAKTPAKGSTPHSATAAPAASGAAGAGGAAGKVPPKGITIVSNKPVRKPKPKKLEMPVSEPLLKSGVKWKPLIASGPKAPPSSGIPGVAVHKTFKADPKAKMSKKELDHYRAILLKKRAELLGDIDNMEDGALRQSSGSLSNMPQHMADQGSDTFEQSMSLSLVDVDRNLIREIDDALKRIMDGSYGVCLHTGRRIPADRLEQVPWTKYTIEAARELERKPIFVRENSYAERAPSSKSENL